MATPGLVVTLILSINCYIATIIVKVYHYNSKVVTVQGRFLATCVHVCKISRMQAFESSFYTFCLCHDHHLDI